MHCGPENQVIRITTLIRTRSSSLIANLTLWGKEKIVEMVCLACLLPLFLVPIVNLLPLLFDVIMSKVYRLFGWEYRKPARAPPACPIKPSASKIATNDSVADKQNLGAPDPSPKPVGTDDDKQD